MEEKIFEVDEEGRLTHFKDGDFEMWFKFDDKGNQIYSGNSDGTEEWYDYDEEGNLIHVRDNEGREEFFGYGSDSDYYYKQTAIIDGEEIK